VSGASLGRLFIAEQRRFWARDAARWLVGLALALVTLINGIQISRSTERLERSSGAVSEVPSQCVTGTSGSRQVVRFECAARQNIAVFDAPGGVDAPPGMVSVLLERGRDRRMNVGAHYRGDLAGTGIALVLLGFVLGSTMLAAEFGALGLTSQLMFEPRRTRLLLTKAASAAVGSATAAVMIVAWIGVGQYVGSLTRGITAGLDGSWWAHRAADVARVALTTALAAVLASGIAVIARRTVVAVTGLFGFIFSIQFLIATSWGKPIARLSPITALWAAAFNSFARDRRALAGIDSLNRALLTSAVWVAALLVVACWNFSSREVR
jgi:hypothetical protein